MGLLKKEKCGVFSSQKRKDYSLLSTERDKELFREKTIEEEAFLQEWPYASNSYSIRQ